MDFFQENGFFRSYSLRQAIGGKANADAKKPEKKQLTTQIPTASPPKRQKTPSNQNTKSKNKLRGFEDEGIDDNPELIASSRPK